MSKTHFGFENVEDGEKASRVREVFDSVATKYDLMNDAMSLGLHRVWKAYAIAVSGVRDGQQVLDIAAGTGDLTRAFAKRVGPTGCVVHSDINEKMLSVGRDRLIDAGVVAPSVVCDAEQLPFASERFDVVSVAFGLRNMTDKSAALREMCRVTKPGGRLLVLEFSKVAKPLEKPYDWYSFEVLPRLGRLIAGDSDSYRYLAESIRMHPGQAELKTMVLEAGYAHVDVHNLTLGVVALHVGIKA